jgi:hypothetical protein
MATQQQISPIDDFSYRKNPDGSFDSICVYCFATVGAANSIAELSSRELAHILECFEKKRPTSIRSL